MKEGYYWVQLDPTRSWEPALYFPHEHHWYIVGRVWALDHEEVARLRIGDPLVMPVSKEAA